MSWVTKFNKNFINAAQLQAQKASGIQRKLVGFEMIDRGIPRQGYTIKDSEGSTIGHVTSGTQSPTLRKSIGLGYVPIAHSKEGSSIYIDIRNKSVQAVVVKPPFLK